MNERRLVTDIYNDASNRICEAIEAAFGLSRIDLVENQSPDQLKTLIRNRLACDVVSPASNTGVRHD